MGLTIEGSGITVVRDTNGSEPAQLSEPVTLSAGTITNHVQGEIDLAAGAAITTLPQGGITTITYIQVECTDKTTGNARSVTLTLNTTALPGSYTEFVASASENGGVTAVKITPQATGNNTIIKYVLGGI